MDLPRNHTRRVGGEQKPHDPQTRSGAQGAAHIGESLDCGLRLSAHNAILAEITKDCQQQPSRASDRQFWSIYYGSATIEVESIKRRKAEISMQPKHIDDEQVIRFADMFAAMGTEARLRILRLLLAAYPQGLIPSDLGSELGIPASTLSHHLEKLKMEGLVTVRREGTFLWYTANATALKELLSFLYAECCTRNTAIQPDEIVKFCG